MTTTEIQQPASTRQKQVLVVGAGLSGSTVARVLAEAGYQVRVTEKKHHVGGNCYDEPHRKDTTLLIQKYGPHIFHTNSQKVVDFLSQFTEWRAYSHRVGVELAPDTFMSMAPNGKSIIEHLFMDYLKYPESARPSIHRDLDLLAAEFPTVDPTILDLMNSKSEFARTLATVLWARVYEPYTRRQWGTNEVDPSVLSRVRVDLKETNRFPTYFKDKFQAMPANGFTRMVENMLDHENIHVELRATNSATISNHMLKGLAAKMGERSYVNPEFEYEHVFYTGPVEDAVSGNLSNSLGNLPYRTMLFNFTEERVASANAGYSVDPYTLFGATLNRPMSVFSHGAVSLPTYPSSLPLPLRTTSFRTLAGEPRFSNLDVICEEFPVTWTPFHNLDRHYPVKNDKSDATYKSYVQAVDETYKGHLTLLGRLGSYQYLNMDQAVAQALKAANDFIEKDKQC